ncbi:MAG: 50S ribosomal protein L25 [Spirochaetaceae bacterium]|nr:50S ribosomal protein L25 [Spirochaetaceae bacterium]
MSNYLFEATLRTSDFGSAGSRRLIRAGKIPAVVYGHKITPTHIVIDARDFGKAVNKLTESTLITLNIEGEESKEVLVKNFQENLLVDKIFHVDFYEVIRGEKLHTSVPVVVEGNPIGCRQGGGILDIVLHEIEVECFPKDLPSVIRVDVSALGINGHITVAELTINENVLVLTPGNEAVATVKALKAEVVEETEDANAPAEVISEKNTDGTDTE